MDLVAILEGESSVYARFGPHDALFGAKASEETIAFGETLEAPKWVALTGRERALEVIRWIREAAAYTRAPRIRYAYQREGAA